MYFYYSITFIIVYMCFRSDFDQPHEPEIFDLCKLCLINMGKMTQHESDIFCMVKGTVIDD